ncbi:2-oxo acid dehydrogenase subunit E2 [Arthrobacter echini]|uniref:Dihydrolipoamide acetyltransferase component of pyruvate dehydrogenase complex n=1 Tax=Arthrobacter echini TaxID=1529066 RepID=A0A5D0XUN2_9MICC|nr:dihydrolipoamide acetyltransferase family protein [Arthrobacter echini]TYD00444.1 2-oxo acid dehydrogenase subunit E2 [Arthrobacter echini]
MTLKTFDLPDVGEGLTEAEIVEWRVAPGQAVAVNDIICEIETAKSLVELSSPYEGTVSELLVVAGETIEVGTPIISVDDARESPGGSAGSGGSQQESSGGSAGSGGSQQQSPGGSAGTTGSSSAALADAIDTPVPAPDMPGEVAGPLVGSGPKADSVKRRPRKSSATAGPGTPSAGTSSRTTPADQRTTPGSPSDTSSTPAGQHTTPVSPSDTSSTPAGQHTTRASPSDSSSTPIPADQRTPRPGGTGGRVLAKPPVRKAARDLGIDLADVPASGSAGDVTKQDLLGYRDRLGGGRGSVPQSVSPSVTPSIASPGTDRGISAGDRIERIPVKGVRKATAEAMVRSAFTAPHASIFVDVDASRTMEFVRRLKASRDYEGIRVSPLLIVARAVIWAAARNPAVNATWGDDEILVKHFLNLGIAAATPRGLMVPNIKDAQDLSLKELALALNELATTARDGRTQPAQMQGGTLTVTNIGALGLDTGTPIINPGEVAIVAFGTIKQKPWVVGGEVVPRWITTLGGSFDHRVVDGELSARFIADVASILEEPALLLD